MNNFDSFSSFGELVVPEISAIRSDDPAEFAASVNGFDARYLPTTNDHRFFKFELTLGSGRLAVLARPPMLYEGAVVSKEGVVCFHLEDSHRTSVNGHTVSADTIALWKAGTDYRAHQQCRVIHCALFMSDSFSAHDWPEPGSIDQVMLTTVESSSHLRSCVRSVVQVMQSEPARFANPNVAKGIDRSIVGSIDEALSSVVLSGSGIAIGHYVRICRRAEEYLRESHMTICSNLEVAKACEVNMRTLHNAFVAVCGMSLGRYLTLRRLWLVRDALCRAGPDDLVKSIALDHGFWHLGRFSTNYRRRFGELPSVTLSRNYSRSSGDVI